MDRGSTKHGPVLDEQLKHETQGLVRSVADSRTDEFNDPESADEEQVGGMRTGGAPVGMTADDVEERSRLGRYIPRSSLPGDRDTLIAGAHDLNAPDDVLETLAALPTGRVYETVSQAWEALGRPNEDVEHRS